MKYCCTRRDLLLGSAGLWVAGNLGMAWGSPRAARATAEHCILLWLGGGPSHLDTFDPKPGTAGGGPFKAIDTAARGVKLAEHLPRLAEQMERVSLIRSLTSREEDHERAWKYLHTGNAPQETVTFPTLGSVVSAETTAPANDLPSFVHIGGYGLVDPGFLGIEHAPFQVPEAGGEVANLKRPDWISESRHERRLKLLNKLNERFGESDQGKVQASAIKFLESKAIEAFDLAAESEETRAAYGDSPFGRGALMARRLVENGVRFVEVNLDGWDTHEDNFEQTRGLCGALDAGFASLIDDLAKRDLLSKTLVVCMGEFGRTPEINAQNGRDHWARAFSAAIAGGGAAGGQVVGATDEGGFEVTERPVPIQDLFATMFRCFGFDPKKTYRTPNGRPIKLVESGRAVEELLV
ncbi:MAG: hypothetical protein A3F84_19665 [Candidatus Handelsmanbacteria bacterium RIFCSPLOWO2_12_FULL_64_10]|uniref:DUF1501 domain-containing protein n=1 Tax=Handelsmanbacteria sp. (strain RIFCSPLOWO2_12_FULL_64_10) TaxID=1817868 RepID=A0A1F6CBA8_HANXR|nr:MAG: hypothetical protein A3F84_19665 [Candidatus Handelsmanbacteria bacterium RIFCSPLOWO2_12_FULL_64_10]